MYEKSIELLNKGIADELQAVNQYMYMHFHAADQGYDPLSAMFRRISIEEMLHIERLAERALYLKGEVDMVATAEVQKVTEPLAMLEFARKLEEGAIRTYNLFAVECAANADSATKRLFEDLVVEEEVHFDQFDTQMEMIRKYGEQFLALQGIERSKTIAATLAPGGTAL
jgi:bacterioferritin